MATKTKDLLKYETIRYAIEGLEKQTVYNYLEKLVKFFDDMNMTPDEVIERRKEDLKSDDNKVKFRWEDRVKFWYKPILDDYKSQGKSTWTAYDFFKAARSFFSRNRYPLRYKRKELKGLVPHRRTKRKLFPSNEEARAIYGFLESYRDKAMFLLMYQTGINEKDIGELNVEDLPDLEGESPYYFDWIRAKTEERYQTCIGEDVAADLKTYLELQGNPEKGALFLTRKGSRMTTRFIREALSPAFKRVTKAKIKSLRDAYSDALDRANIMGDVKKKMMGHKAGGSADFYETSPYAIIEAYKKAYKYLSINEFRTTKNRLDKTVVELSEIVMKLTEIIMSPDPKEAAKAYRARLEEGSLTIKALLKGLFREEESS